ncbi:hypothetical protein K449DRAFT_385689 [Hypoxylon sp. EC38]|nr:hypothetical protein K449DRAFT_385689 [Hypoxylon sp. EC38]
MPRRRNYAPRVSTSIASSILKVADAGRPQGTPCTNLTLSTFEVPDNSAISLQNSGIMAQSGKTVPSITCLAVRRCMFWVCWQLNGRYVAWSVVLATCMGERRFFCGSSVMMMVFSTM